jgi:outer membrane autotransporter protein
MQAGTLKMQGVFVSEFRQSDGRHDVIQVVDNGSRLTLGGTVVSSALSRVVRSGSYVIAQGAAGSIDGAFRAQFADFFGAWASASKDERVSQVADRIGDTAVLRSSVTLRKAPLLQPGSLGAAAPSAVDEQDQLVMQVTRKSYGDAEFSLGINAGAFARYLDRMVEDPGSLMALIVNLDAADIPTLRGLLESANLGAYADLLMVSRRRVQDLALGLGARLDLLGLMAARNGGVDINAGSGSEGWSLWTSTVVSLVNRGAQSGGFGGYSANGQSSMMGVERPFGGMRLGFVAATGNTSSNHAAPSASVSGDHWHIGSYLSVPVAPFFADIAFMIGRSENEAKRPIRVPTFGADARGSFRTDEFLLRLGGGFQVMPAQSVWEITPTEHLLYVGALQSGFGETTGGLLGARLGRAKNVGLLNELGLTVGRRWVVQGVGIAVRLQGNWLHDFDGAGNLQASLLAAPSGRGDFLVRSMQPERNAFRFNGSVEFAFTRRISLRLTADREYRKGSVRNYFNVTLGIEF